MITETLAMIIYVIWMWVFYYRATTRIDEAEYEISNLKAEIKELKSMIYIAEE